MELLYQIGALFGNDIALLNSYGFYRQYG